MKVCPVCGTEYGDDAAFCSRDRSPLRPTESGSAQGLIGQLVGDRYHVERRLGEGGMGEVYLATHVMMGRRCALKVMSQAVSKDPDAVSRFNREATSASRITHPNVCAVYDFGLTPDGLVYLAMEFVDGRTLTAVVDESGPMPVRAAAALISQCAAGLQAAHDLGIVHRDLKPDNIMVVDRKGRETIKLVDFGIAKAMEGEPAQRVTKTGFVVGTPEYMSPEQLAGDPLDGRSDQYSLALVFYRLITGRLPFEGSSIQETLVKRLTDPPRSLALSRPEGSFPAGLQEVMDRALARQPDDRYPGVTAFAHAIETVLAADGVSTRKLDTAPAGAGIPATRKLEAVAGPRRRSFGLVAAILVGGAGAAWGVLKLTGSPAAPVPAPTPQALTDTSHLAAIPAPVPPAPTPVPPSPVPAPSPAQTKPPVTVPRPEPRETVTIAADADTSAPNLNALETPALRASEIQRSMRLLRAPKVPPHRRAAAAAFLGTAALDAGKRDTALALFRMAYRWDPKPYYLKLIRQFGDTVTP